MNKLLVGAIATGLVGSSVISGAGVAAGDSVLIVPGTAPPAGPAKQFYHFKPEWVPQIAQKYYNNALVTNNPGDLDKDGSHRRAKRRGPSDRYARP